MGRRPNVVNVILVDFRGYDTLGEITVLGIAAIGVALMDGMRTRPDADQKVALWTFAQQPLLLRVAASVVLPWLALVFSLYIFMRGQPARWRLHRQVDHGGGAGVAVHVAGRGAG